MNPFATRSTHPVTHVAFAPDGGTFAVAQPHHGVSVHDRITAEPIRLLGSPRNGWYSSVVYSGGRLAVSSQKGLDLYDPATGSAVYDRRWFGKYLYLGKNLLLAADGTDLVVAEGSSVFWLYLPADGEGTPGRKPLWWGNGPHVRGLSAGGRWAVAARSDTAPELVGISRRRVVAVLDHPGRLETLAGKVVGGPDVVFAPAGDRFAVCDGKTVAVFDPTPEEEPEPGEDDSPLVQRDTVAPPPRAVLAPVFTLNPPDGWRQTVPWRPPVAFTPDGRGLLVRRPGNKVQWWDVPTGAKRDQWSWRFEIRCLAVAPDGLTAAAGGRFGQVIVWDLG